MHDMRHRGEFMSDVIAVNLARSHAGTPARTCDGWDDLIFYNYPRIRGCRCQTERERETAASIHAANSACPRERAIKSYWVSIRVSVVPVAADDGGDGGGNTGRGLGVCALDARRLRVRVRCDCTPLSWSVLTNLWGGSGHVSRYDIKCTSCACVRACACAY